MHLENFQFPIEEKGVYPYELFADKGLEHVEFAPVTIFYGNNGSGKSTILNIIAERAYWVDEQNARQYKRIF